jgi:SAM-dependent methyltransferase
MKILNGETTSNSPSLWLDEYQQKGIPSSHREAPSGAVVDFVSHVKKLKRSPGRVVDIGAGSGRNSLFLADNGFSVVAMDFVPEMVKQLSDAGEKDVRAICHDIATPWPLEDSVFEFAIDTFCFKHQVTSDAKRNYHREIRRVLKNSGLLLLTCADMYDGYYGPLLLNSPDTERNLIIDPQNGIPSLLYTKKSLMAEFSDCFEVVFHQQKNRRNVMHGKSYDRSTHVFIFQKMSGSR